MSPTIRPKCVLVALVSSIAVFAQSASQSDPRPAFTVADVHTAAPTANPVLIGAIPQINRFELRGATMVDMIRIAWGVDAARIIGGPAWLETDRFDVVAKVAAGSTREAMNTMLQGLLAERFGLVIHDDTRDLRAFVMTVAKGGPKLKKSDATDDADCKQPQGDSQSGSANNIYACRNMTVSALAQFLPAAAPAYFRGTPLVDRTKLDGSWDFTVKWTSFGLIALAGADGVPLFDYLDKQLGLHIELSKAALPVLIVNSVNEKPTDNVPGISDRLPEPPKEFEAAVIKPSQPGATQSRAKIQNGSVNAQNLTLKDLLTMLWDLPEDRIAGIPSFAESDRYDIVAKAPAGASQDYDSLRAMAQALLKDRFKIDTHTEDRPVEVFLLVATKPKLKKAEAGNRSSCRNTASTSVILSKSLECQNISMAQFAAWLGSNVGGYIRQRPVLDGTGLDGAWDFTLAFSNPLVAAQGASGRSNQDSSGTPAPADPNGALTLFEALEKQLGLKLETQKRPMPVLVIDHIEPKPTDN